MSSVGLGRSPLRMIWLRSRSIFGSGTGTADISARVYGCRGEEKTSSTGPYSTIRPRYITAI